MTTNCLLITLAGTSEVKLKRSKSKPKTAPTTFAVGTFWALFGKRGQKRLSARLQRTEFVWSGRSGSNRRRPAWEFSIENSIFSFTNKTLSRIFHSQDLLLMSSDFN